MINITLEKVNNIPSDSGYWAKIKLPKGLQTTYNKDLIFTQGLLASAAIVTENLKFSDRIFNQIKAIIRNRK
jgi:hypothetical protein